MKKAFIKIMAALGMVFVLPVMAMANDAFSLATNGAAASDEENVVQELSVSEISVILNDSCSVNAIGTSEGFYLFLPSYADISALKINFNIESTVYVSGDKGGKEITSGDAIDIGELATQNSDGTYTIGFKSGEYDTSYVTVMKSSQIYAMFLASDNIEEYGRVWVDASKSNEAIGTMKMFAADGTAIYDGALTQIKPRGNSTFKYYDKKSYQIKLDKKTDLLGTGEKVKTWVLLAGYSDATQLRDKTFKELATALDMPYTVSCDWVDLYYDGEYRGTYLLTEKNSIGSEAIDITDMEDAYETAGNENYGDNAVTEKDFNQYGNEYQYSIGLTEPADITGGYLIELNHSSYDEASGFKTNQGIAFNVKSPEYAGRDAMIYISEYYQEFEHAVYAVEGGVYTGKNPVTGKYYYEYCDKDSLVKMYLIQEISGNIDGFASSFFFYKDAGDIMYAGPVWDMEAIAGTGWDEFIVPERDFLHTRYLAKALIEIPDFRQAVEDYFKTFASEIEELIGDGGKIAEYEAIISDSATMNYVLWPFVRIGDPAQPDHLWALGTTHADAVDAYEHWLAYRLNELRKDYDPSAVSEIAPFPEIPSSLRTETRQNEDGSVTTIETNEISGTVTETTVYNDGSKIVLTKQADGTVIKEEISAKGVVLQSVQKLNEDIVYRVSLPYGINNANVFIPVEHITPYSVAVNYDGEVFPICAATEGGLLVNVTSSGEIRFKENKVQFVDVADAWYAASVSFVAGRGIMNGMSEAVFAPTENLTRAMLVQILYNIEADGANGYSNIFSDVPFGIWYDDAVNWAAAVNLLEGYGDGTVRPMLPVTREQMVTMLYRYFILKGYDISAKADLTSYADADNVSDWAVEAVEWAVGSGLITGVSDSMLAPEKEASRAEVATIMMRLCNLILNQ